MKLSIIAEEYQWTPQQGEILHLIYEYAVLIADDPLLERGFSGGLKSLLGGVQNKLKDQKRKSFKLDQKGKDTLKKGWEGAKAFGRGTGKDLAKKAAHYGWEGTKAFGQGLEGGTMGLGKMGKKTLQTLGPAFSKHLERQHELKMAKLGMSPRGNGDNSGGYSSRNNNGNRSVGNNPAKVRETFQGMLSTLDQLSPESQAKTINTMIKALTARSRGLNPSS